MLSLRTVSVCISVSLLALGGTAAAQDPSISYLLDRSEIELEQGSTQVVSATSTSFAAYAEQSVALGQLELGSTSPSSYDEATLLGGVVLLAPKVLPEISGATPRTPTVTGVVTTAVVLGLGVYSDPIEPLELEDENERRERRRSDAERFEREHGGDQFSKTDLYGGDPLSSGSNSFLFSNPHPSYTPQWYEWERIYGGGGWLSEDADPCSDPAQIQSVLVVCGSMNSGGGKSMEPAASANVAKPAESERDGRGRTESSPALDAAEAAWISAAEERSQRGMLPPPVKAFAKRRGVDPWSLRDRLQASRPAGRHMRSLTQARREVSRELDAAEAAWIEAAKTDAAQGRTPPSIGSFAGGQSVNPESLYCRLVANSEAAVHLEAIRNASAVVSERLDAVETAWLAEAAASVSADRLPPTIRRFARTNGVDHTTLWLRLNANTAATPYLEAQRLAVEAASARLDAAEAAWLAEAAANAAAGRPPTPVRRVALAHGVDPTSLWFRLKANGGAAAYLPSST